MYKRDLIGLSNEIQRLALGEGFLNEEIGEQNLSFYKTYPIDFEKKNSASFAQSIAGIFYGLGISDIKLEISHAGIIIALAKKWAFEDKIDMIPKIYGLSENEMIRTLGNAGFTETQIHQIQHLMRLKGTTFEKLDVLDNWFSDIEIGKQAMSEIRELFYALDKHKILFKHINTDFLNVSEINQIQGIIVSVSQKISSINVRTTGGKSDKNNEKNSERFTLSFEITDQ